jgi:hypothetical protein
MILTKIITTSKAEILVLGGLPEDAEIKDYLSAKISAIWTDPNGHNLMFPDGNWQLLGKLHEVTEGQASHIVEETDNPFHYGQGNPYIKYGTDTECVFTALESLQSLIEANCNLENAFGGPPRKDQEKYHKVWNADCFDRKYYEDDLAKWQQEQRTVFTNPVVFLKE